MLFLQGFKQKNWAQIFIVCTRYLIGAAFVYASVVKIQGGRFTAVDGIEAPINSAWHFFETLYQSGLYWNFIGLGQLIAGLLLMTQRYAKLGAVINFPIVANVFVITLSYDFNSTPVITGLMTLANLLLLLWDWDSLRVLFNLPQLEGKEDRLEKDNVWELTGLALFSFTLIMQLIKMHHVLLWLVGCSLIGIVGLVFGLKRMENYKSV